MCFFVVYTLFSRWLTEIFVIVVQFDVRFFRLSSSALQNLDSLFCFTPCHVFPKMVRKPVEPRNCLVLFWSLLFACSNFQRIPWKFSNQEGSPKGIPWAASLCFWVLSCRYSLLHTSQNSSGPKNEVMAALYQYVLVPSIVQPCFLFLDYLVFQGFPNLILSLVLGVKGA